MIIILCLSSLLDIVNCVGPDLTARDRLVKDLPNGVFAGKKLTPKVVQVLLTIELQIRTKCVKLMKEIISA